MPYRIHTQRIISMGIPLFPTTMRYASNEDTELNLPCVTHSIINPAWSNSDFCALEISPARELENEPESNGTALKSRAGKRSFLRKLRSIFSLHG